MALKSLIILIGFVVLAQTAATNCSSTSPYNLTTTGQCYIQCPWIPPTMYYGYPLNLTCVTTCPDPYFAFIGNQTCLTSCPTSPSMTYYDHINRKCVTTCPANTYAASNQSCLTSCPAGSWGNQGSNLCVTTCPVGTFYSNVTVPLCVTVCPVNYYASPIDRICYVGGSCPLTPVRYYSDDTQGLCVQNCPANYFADPTNGRCVIFCSSVNYFADPTTRLCVQNCPSGYFRSTITKSCIKSCTIGYFADSITGNCTQICSLGTFGDSTTKLCSSLCTLPLFADPSVRLCVSICSSGLYSDSYTQSCVVATSCYSNTIGDPTSNQCIPNTNCPTVPYMFADLTNKICTTRCSTWGNTVTRLCVSQCPWDSNSFVTWGNPDTNQCVTRCPTFPIRYADNFTKTCVSTCPQYPNVTYNTFADPTTQSCVKICPDGYSADLNKLMCVSVCTTYPVIQYYDAINGLCVTKCPNGYFADPSKGQCTTNCSTNPMYFAYSVNNTCLFTCPTGYYGDNSTGNCVLQCPQTTLQFADDSVNLCVTTCPLFPDTYGQIGIDGYRRCVVNCSFNTFADPLTRLCVSFCKNTNGYYGLTNTSRCILQCPDGTFADNTTSQCVSKCPNFPIKFYGNPNTKACITRCPIYLYGNSNNNLCVIPTGCPSGFFAENTTRMCVSLCPSNTSTFGQPTSKLCVQVCPQGMFADSTSRLCSSSCNTAWNLYRDNSTKTCVKSCPSNPNYYADPLTNNCSLYCSGGYFAYDATRMCVAICPSNPPTYGNYQTMRCVASCPRQTYVYSNNSFRACVTSCPQRVYSPLYIVDMFADNSTWSCVTVCPKTQNLYSFKHPTDTSIRLCVLTCPNLNNTYYFAENSTQSCVTSCPSSTLLTYGDIFTSKCVQTCSRNQFRDNTTNRCVYKCSESYYADNTTWNCVTRCPAGLYAQTTNRTCSKHCPNGSYANNQTRYCQSLCNTELYLYSDNTTWQCLPSCSVQPDFYADPNTKLCSKSCTGGLFADNWTRSCLPALNCSNSTIGDSLYYRCIPICPISIPSFLDSTVNQCKQVCPIGMFADNSTMKCVLQCPFNPDYYAYNVTLSNGTITQGLCVLFCPLLPNPYYRHNQTRQCLLSCPGPNYFRDTTTLRCVMQCPEYFYAEVIGQICVSNCSSNNKYGFNGSCYATCPNNTNADNTTYLCVDTCPFGYFAENNKCVINCQYGYADPFLKICVQVCSPDYYSYSPTLECRQNCQPQYKYFFNQSCIVDCPTSSNLSTNLYKDNTTFSCLSKCLPTWYADNLTGFCTQTCSATLFADNSTGLCVNKCPQTPDYYGWNLVCYFPCPIQNSTLFAQNITRTCMTVCPNNSYADNYTRRCVANCTLTQYGFTDGVTPICVNQCFSPTFGNNITKTCINKCPDGTFGEANSRLCLLKCPAGTYGDTHLNLCVAVCNNSIPEFADPTSHLCVIKCPSTPSLYGDFNGTNKDPVCVSSCSQSSNFTLNTTRLCVPNCPEPFFADSITGDCATYCQPKSNLFADNVSRSCTSCPNITITIVVNSTFNTTSTVFTYADPSTMTCVYTCPSNPSLYGDNFTNTCVGRCPTNSYGDSDARLCVQTCFFGIVVKNNSKFTYADNSTNFCVYFCPQNTWADNYTISCTSQCTSGTFADDSTWKCVAMCPANPISYSYAPTRKCIYGCPNKFFASQVGRVCLNGTCPKTPNFYYRDNQNNQCVLKCVYPYFGEMSSQTCATNCSYGFYQDLGNMACSKCPTQCLTCINTENCTTCQKNFYIFLGKCLKNCPSFPIYYFKYDPSMSCINACPVPYFGFKGTGKCQKQCPVGYFNNLTTSQCENCPQGCSNCYGVNCTSCFTGYVYVSKYAVCNKICSTALPYFLNDKCISSCGAGTFMLDDLVTCQRCNPICQECSKLPSNCTKCSALFWYDYNCVKACPSNYYVDPNLVCQLCSNNPTACTLPPLSYTVTTKIISYQLYCFVTFNRKVTLNSKQFAKIAKIKTQKGPILASMYFIEIIQQTVYKLTFYNSASLNQLTLSVGFEPGSIGDISGNKLTQTSSSASIPVVTTITKQTQAQAKKMSNQVNIVSWILIIVIISMMIKQNYPMIILLDLVQFIHMHIYVIAIPLPYLYMQVISVLKNLNFAFLPVLYTNSKNNISDPYYNFQPDTTFLGNCQPFVFFFIIFGGTYLLFWVLSQKKINRWKFLRNKIRSIWKGRMRYSFLHQLFYYTEYYVLFFAFYQFTGANSSIQAANTNLAAAVIVSLLYTIWLISITYQAVKYKRKLSKIPQKFNFLKLQQSQFPMQIPLRGLFKMMVACALISTQASIQITLLIIFNLTMIIYTVCFKPSKHNSTNRLNIFIHLAMIIHQIVQFIYLNSSMSSSYQNTISYGLFAVIGVTIFVVFLWIIYRFVVYVRQECFGIKPTHEVDQSELKENNIFYQKVKQSTSQRISIEDKELKLQKEMNVSQLNIKDEQQRQSENYSIDADKAIQQFTYHYVPKKSQGMIKQEKAILGIKEQKKNMKPIVIQIDQDQLIEEDAMSRMDSRMSRSRPNKRIKSSFKQLRGHLRIEGDQLISQIQQIQVKPKIEKQQSKNKKSEQKQKKVMQPHNLIVWDENNVDGQQEIN